MVALSDSLPDVQARVRCRPASDIALPSPLEMLDRATGAFRFHANPIAPRIDPAARAPGLILNYDLVRTARRRLRVPERFERVAVVRRWGLACWSNTMVTRWSTAWARSRAVSIGTRIVRLDTSWQFDLPDSDDVGDRGRRASRGALSWTRSTRIGGVRVSRNFALQPYRITAPLASFAGEAVLPSTVDLLHQRAQAIQPSRCSLANSRSTACLSLNGVGQAQLVITDINGQSRLVDFSLYGTPATAASRALGLVARPWCDTPRHTDSDSFDYAGEPLFSATGRYGLMRPRHAGSATPKPAHGPAARPV